MADLIAVVFPTEERAEEARNKVLELQKDYLIEIGDAVIATKTPGGKVKLNQLLNTTAAGAAGGSFWGLLIGVLFMNPLLGVAAGAASGAVAGALTDIGVDDKFMKGLSANIKEGEAVLFVLVKKVTGDKVLEQLKGIGGTVLQTSLDHTREDALRKALAGEAPVSYADAAGAAARRGRGAARVRRPDRDRRGRPDAPRRAARADRNRCRRRLLGAEYDLETGTYYRWRIVGDGLEEYEVAAEELFENSWVEKVSVEDVAFAVDGLGEIELGGDDEVDVWFVPIRPGDYAFGVEGREDDDGFAGVMHVR